jgi:hypothetical protein
MSSAAWSMIHDACSAAACRSRPMDRLQRPFIKPPVPSPGLAGFRSPGSRPPISFPCLLDQDLTIFPRWCGWVAQKWTELLRPCTGHFLPEALSPAGTDTAIWCFHPRRSIPSPLLVYIPTDGFHGAGAVFDGLVPFSCPNVRRKLLMYSSMLGNFVGHAASQEFNRPA